MVALEKLATLSFYQAGYMVYLTLNAPGKPDDTCKTPVSAVNPLLLWNKRSDSRHAIHVFKRKFHLTSFLQARKY